MPYQVAVYPNDDIAVADFGDRKIVVFSPDGIHLKTFTHPELTSPSAIYIAKNNDIIVGKFCIIF
jgi:hypothetical protein